VVAGVRGGWNGVAGPLAPLVASAVARRVHSRIPSNPEARDMATRERFRRPLELGSRMLPTDAMFWYVEEATPELRPLVAALLILDRRPDRERLRACVERWIARVPRLRQRVVETPFHLGLPEWEDDPNFELDYHAREVILPAPATERHLLDFVGAVFATPLDHMRPLWESYLIEGLDGDRAACFFKVHHSVMDGVGSVAAFDALTQAHRHEPVRVPRHAAPRASSSSAVRFGRVLRDAARNSGAGVGWLAMASWGALRRPAEALDDLRRGVRGLRGMIADLGAPAVVDPLARHSTGIGRRLDVMTLSIPRLRTIKCALDATLNDVVLTVVCGAVARYHQHRGMSVDELHCMVPMSLRSADESGALGNRVGAFNVALPVGNRDPLMRLELIRNQTCAAKRDRRGAAYPVLMRAMASMPGFAYRLLAQNVTGRINLICTNVPGPVGARYLGGAKIEALYPFAPVALGTPLSIALMSHGDDYGIGIDTDPAAIPDPDLLSRYLAAAVAELEARALPRTRPKRARRRRRAA
jgi:diacylglycerol O-acyltransferase / wax synthase